MGFGFLKKKKKTKTAENILDIGDDIMNMKLDGSG